MGMSLEELETESAELIPAREVMCAATYSCHRGGSSWCANGQSNDGSGNDVTQFGLINVNDSFNNINVLGFVA